MHPFLSVADRFISMVLLAVNMASLQRKQDNAVLSGNDHLFDDMLRRADKAMYSAKALGRNRMQLDNAIAAI